MCTKVPETIQLEIWERSKNELIGQIAKRYGISYNTTKKYMNPAYL